MLVFVYSLRALLRSNRIICHIFCSCREIDLLLQIFRESISHKMIIKRMHICVDVVDSAHLFYEPIKYFNVKHLFENAVSCKYIMEWKLLYLRWLKCQGYLKWFPYFGFPWTALKIYPVIVVISIAGKQVATLSMKLVHLSWCCLITRCEKNFIRDFLQPITIFLTIGVDFKLSESRILPILDHDLNDSIFFNQYILTNVMLFNSGSNQYRIGSTKMIESFMLFLSSIGLIDCDDLLILDQTSSL